MAISDGNGWVECPCGGRHWGLHGAAGLFLLLETPHAEAEVLLQHRAPWSHQGSTWGLPGGARDSHEDVVTAALRETWEEAGVDAASSRLLGVHKAVHPGWSYTTVLMRTDQRHTVTIQEESLQVAWVPLDEVANLPLHPGLSAAWPQLVGPHSTVVVDIANVMGSRPDGWWRDRARRAQTLVDDLSGIPGTTVAPDGSLVTMVEAIVEGQARNTVATDPAVLVTAASTADDYIAATVGPHNWVVTADRELRDRAEARGARVIGPRWVLDLLEERR